VVLFLGAGQFIYGLAKGYGAWTVAGVILLAASFVLLLAWFVQSRVRKGQVESAPAPPPARQTDPAPHVAVADVPREGDQNRSPADRLAALYHEGQRLLARFRAQRMVLVTDFLQGTKDENQVARERGARDWDSRILEALPDNFRGDWRALEPSLGRESAVSKVEPVTDLNGVGVFVQTRLEELRDILAAMDDAADD
jgi:hypothetical protein